MDKFDSAKTLLAPSMVTILKIITDTATAMDAADDTGGQSLATVIDLRTSTDNKRNQKTLEEMQEDDVEDNIIGIDVIGEVMNDRVDTDRLDGLAEDGDDLYDMNNDELYNAADIAEQDGGGDD